MISFHLIGKPWIRLAGLVILFFSPLFCESALSQEAPAEPLMDTALKAIAMHRPDLSIRPDLFDSRYGLPLFTRWMRNPLQAPREAQQISRALFASARNPDLWLRDVARCNGMDIYAPTPAAEDRPAGIADGFPLELRRALGLLLPAMQTANAEFQNIKSVLTPSQRALLENYFYQPGSLPEPPDQEDEFGRHREARQAVALLDRVNQPAMLQSGLQLLRALEAAKKILLQRNDWNGIESASFMTGLGLVKIGGSGPDVHQDKAVLIIDLGGNDLYRGTTAAGVNECAIVLDLSGHDVYLGENATQGWGFWGIGILHDLSGDDLYRAENCAQGAGLFGLGLLIDAQGADTYSAGNFVQAASFWGLGGLLDLGGEDTYQCRAFGQAYAETNGISVLCDLSGNDKYLSGAGRPDYREPDLNQSFAQGFSMGIRNLAAGGFALLADQSGHDCYQCQYFGQGASYWMGIGLLYDEYGKDSYTARRYSQGAGIHFSLGMLLDGEGDDHAYSWGVSQGCGHDFGIGILANETGNDTYVADWLCLGASEANGIGLFVDNSGDDGYDTKTGMAVADLVPGRRAGGIGIFLDAGGNDRYAQKGRNNGQWSTTRWAVGLDAEKPDASGLNLNKPDQPSPRDRGVAVMLDKQNTRLREMLQKAQALSDSEKVEALLAVISQSNDREPGKDAEKMLLDMDPQKSIPVLIGRLDTPDIMRQIFFERIFGVHAYAALPYLTDKCLDPDPLVRARALAYLGHLKDTRTLAACLQAIPDASWRVRASAGRALGEILARERLLILVPMLTAFQGSFSGKDPELIRLFCKEKDRLPAVLSVLVRALPLAYGSQQKWSQKQAEWNEEQYLEFSRFVFDHLPQIVPLLEQWIRDIRASDRIAQILMPNVDDPDPDVRRSVAYSLGQMKHQPAVPRLLALLQDPYFMVRDTAVLSLAFYGPEVIPELENNMDVDPPALLILKLDILARVGGEKARQLVARYTDHPEEPVQRMAGQALKIIAAQTPPAGVDAGKAE